MCDKHQHDTSTTVTETPASQASTTEATEATTSSCCGGHDTAASVADVSTHDDLAECPVMPGSVVNKTDAEAAGLYRDHDGQRYWFCCAACGPMWDADPDKYVAA